MNKNLLSTDFLLRQHVRSLKTHLSECRADGAWPLRARCLGEQLFALSAPRLFTTIAVAGLALSVTLAAASHWA